MAQRQEFAVMRGGLDLVSSALVREPGTCIGALNYEADPRGYRRIQGGERFDGQLAPSEARAVVMSFELQGPIFVGPPVVGDVIRGVSTSARATVLEDAVILSGSWAGGTATGTVVVMVTTFSFQEPDGPTPGERVNINSDTAAAMELSAPFVTAGDTEEEQRTYLALASATARAEIQEVPGTGPIRGLFSYNGAAYAIRDEDAFTAKIFEAGLFGWQELGPFWKIPFTQGYREPTIGNYVRGRTSAGLTIVSYVHVESGSWAGDDAAGFFIVSSDPTDLVNEIVEDAISSLRVATVDMSGLESVELPAGGRYRHITHNFFGQDGTESTFLVNGVGRCIEFKGQPWPVIVPIEAIPSETKDKPKFVAEYANHLFLGYDGGSLLFSGIGNPRSFDAIDGAGEVATGHDLTGLIGGTLGALIITGKSTIAYLTGTSSDDFEYSVISDSSGAVEDTAVVVGEPYFLDDIGVRSLEAAEAYGNWSIGTVTTLVQPFMEERRGTCIGAARVRAKDQYRLFFSDGSGMSIYFGFKTAECMPFKLWFNPTIVTVIKPEPTAYGSISGTTEAIFAAGDDGYVYRLDAGNSFDGDPLPFHVVLSYSNQKMPRSMKRYHSARFEIEAGASALSLDLGANVSSGDGDVPTAGLTTVPADDATFWDGTVWQNFHWANIRRGSASLDIGSVGDNVSLAVSGSTTLDEPHVISSVALNYTERRRLRG